MANSQHDKSRREKLYLSITNEYANRINVSEQYSE
ncbi:hypothetical protein CLV51_10384 [Chitinophaga niastensis]|uniref:Uncharacterized protein n=1 Tax=Chitinophaga niastensis TaxID=536980 RepID=A0A2P8HIR6_CHINA|nr:hypothetical protein CLV51_10384 [Chitinophaga niastensis]